MGFRHWMNPNAYWQFNLVLIFRPSIKVELCKELDVELRGDFPRVGRQEPSRSWRKVYYLLRADARVHSGKLSQVTDDQADPGDAQATAERECVAKGGGQYTMYILNYSAWAKCQQRSG